VRDPGHAIEVRDLSKDFLLPHLQHTTLKRHVLDRFHPRRRTVEVQHALRDVGFTVRRGEFFGIVGRNGSGKSTLLKILAGIYCPTSGTTEVDGRLVPFIELGVGFNPNLTGRDNVYLNGALLGFSRTEMDERYDEIVRFAELEDSMDQKLKNYSSGMHVRIAFAVATHARADVLLIDEVLAVGDAAFQRKCFEHFRALKKSGTTIVFVTHDMSSVRGFCDRAILLEDSRLVAEGGAEDIAERYLRLFAAPQGAPPPHAEPDAGRAAQGPDAEDGARMPAGEGAAPAPGDADAGGEAEGDPAPPQRWGEGGVRFTHVHVPEVVDGDGELVIDLEAAADADVPDPVFGFMIANSAGTPVLGTNSNLKKRVCDDLSAGDRVRVRWAVPNVFSDGDHSVTVAVTDRQGLAVHDWWNDAAVFTVRKDEKTPYIVTPDAELTIERLEPGDR
jgi:ABC-2 type transport system ATP-binding protein